MHHHCCTRANVTVDCYFSSYTDTNRPPAFQLEGPVGVGKPLLRFTFPIRVSIPQNLGYGRCTAGEVLGDLLIGTRRPPWLRGADVRGVIDLPGHLCGLAPPA